MEVKISFIFIVLFIINYNLYSAENTFSLLLILGPLVEGNYTLQTKDEKGNVYIISSVTKDVYFIGNPIRYVIKYDANTCSFVKQFQYDSAYNLVGGEACVLEDGSKYIYVSILYPKKNKAFREIGNYISRGSAERKECNIYGYRRVLKKVGSFYYQIYLDKDSQSFIYIDKMRINGYTTYFPILETTTFQTKVKVNKGEEMISCDFTYDNNYIICAYYLETFHVTISIFNNQNQLIFTQTYEKLNYYTSNDNFIKIVYLKDSSDFVMIVSQDNYTSRLRYFNYKYNRITDKLSPITKTGKII